MCVLHTLASRLWQIFEPGSIRSQEYGRVIFVCRAQFAQTRHREELEQSRHSPRGPTWELVNIKVLDWRYILKLWLWFSKILPNNKQQSKIGQKQKIGLKLNIPSLIIRIPTKNEFKRLCLVAAQYHRHCTLRLFSVFAQYMNQTAQQFKKLERSSSTS